MSDCLRVMIALLLTVTFCRAQAPSRDIIYLQGGRQIKSKVVRITERTIQYKLPADPANGALRVVIKKNVWKIVYGSGKVIVVNQPPAAAPPVVAPPVQTAVAKPDSLEKPADVAAAVPPPVYETPSSVSATVVSKPTVKNRPGRIQVTLGPEFSYYPSFVNNQRAWLNDSTGFGMTQNVGASLRVDYRLLRPLAISITAGYYGWELVRRYTREGINEYSETKRLTQIPVQFGLKLRPGGGLYVMPEGGVNLLFASVKTSDAHPTPANESVTSTPLTYGASIGYEMNLKALLFDLSLRYQILNVTNFRYVTFNQSLKEQVNVATIRLGIGFGSNHH